MINKRNTQATLVAIGTIACFSIAKEARALPQYEIETFCYGDPDNTVQIGYMHLFCNGHVTRQGECTGAHYLKQEVGSPCFEELIPWDPPRRCTLWTCDNYVTPPPPDAPYCAGTYSTFPVQCN